MNTFGRRLRIHIMGESHGAGVGVVLDGVPSGITVDEARIAQRMEERRPGQSPLTTQRSETDHVRFLTGVHDGHTTGAPVTLWIDNEDTRSKDYSHLLRTPRPGHSDWVAGVWAHGFQDHRGGGHYSGRLTAPLVAAAAMLEAWLHDAGITVGAHVHQVGPEVGPAEDLTVADMGRSSDSLVHTAHEGCEDRFVAAVDAARRAGDSLGGIIRWRAEGVPVAWGDPLFDSIESHLAHILFSIPAVKGVAFGDGFASAGMKGSEHNDSFTLDGDRVVTTTNHSGGILGGRSTGMPLWGSVAIKPTSSIFQPQKTVDLEAGTDATLELKGRHDPCIAIRAAPVVRACILLGLADLLLLARQEGHGGQA